jgi:hypothetical protein
MHRECHAPCRWRVWLDDWAVRTFAVWKVGRKGLDDGIAPVAGEVPAVSFATFALLPILGLLAAPASLRLVAIAVVTLVSLGLLGLLGGRLACRVAVRTGSSLAYTL